MEVVFKEGARKPEPKIDYGTILMCQSEKNPNGFSLYRVSNPGLNPDKYGLSLLYNEMEDEARFWSGTYNSGSEIIEGLKDIYDGVEVVSAHIVIDEVIGEV